MKADSFPKEHGIETVYGIVLAENEQMLALGKKLGFEIKRDPEYGGYDLSLDLIKFS
jgi:acetyltransferase